MTLLDLLASRHEWADDETIYVVEPWNCLAEALITNEDAIGTNPIIRSGQCYSYFLEGFIARNFLEELDASAKHVSKEACDRLIHYAIYDA